MVVSNPALPPPPPPPPPPVSVQELARDRQHVYSARERRRKEIQDEAETKECTFRPNIVAATGTGAAEDGRPDGPGGPRLPLHERLHKEAREREAAKALAQHHLEAELLRECTFQVTGGQCAICFLFALTVLHLL